MPDFDLLLIGATGFTGGLTADHLAEHAPEGLRWALAGRSPDKLAAVRDRLAGIRPELAELPLLELDLTDPAATAELVSRAKVVVTTVGPYLQHGESLVAACAETGTDYVDLTGEPEFVDLMYVRHHSTAVRTGARIVHACGFDSVPHDLGVLHAMRALQPTGPVEARGVVRASAQFSGGTFHSALGAFSRAREMKEAAGRRRAMEKRAAGGAGRRVRATAGRPHRDPLLGFWLVPLPTIDPQVVARSARALDLYGPAFTYSHYAGTKTLRWAAGGAAGAAGLAVAAQVPPLREALLRRLPAGSGPSAERRARSWFTVDVVAESEGRVQHSRVSGGDPGYTETARMLASAGLCLALDDNPTQGGSLTTAQAMGENLLARLEDLGIRFETVPA
ncbi:saccharopine dehydrogenase family protein [Nocardioides bruguierae]|uniref:Saccharopine dehydrogenase NADP-binding domain-containing protein n=1 Tax=Nocardioides bruguierae TaxID=2945102 RepID=A0A9X2DCI1_9ACTN|nr:saccharopine dehydrogenase NADP-binding domain-containing protein [Nocardioides bruguierae]MCM0621974.1 saccharopine dehydrogenase NADP-binding domain-containing protein [Nocardioides bruguierae]